MSPGSATSTHVALDALAHRVRGDFPILTRRLAGDLPLVYLDSANTSQKPQIVIDTIADHYAHHNANVARAMHQLGAESTEAYEGSRDKVAAFIGAPNRDEIVFAKNASEGLNLAAHSLGASLRPGDEVVITELEHHSNIVPWQLLCARTGATLRWFGVTDGGRLDLEAARSTGLINEHTKIVSLAYVSNTLATINPVSEIAAWAHAVGSAGAGAAVVVDASQAVPQLPVDVSTLGADMFVFTGHKVVGPTGIGVLWGRYDLLAELPPFLGGGEMIETVAMTGSTFAEPPHRFEAGTPMIAQAVALGAAVDYVTALGMHEIREHEKALTSYALDGLQTIDGLRIMGPDVPVDRGATISFTLPGVHPHDVAQLLDEQGIAVRAGHHCARPVHAHYGISATTRASFGVYTTPDEIDALVRGVENVREVFA